jgi:hypothetical protein
MRYVCMQSVKWTRSVLHLRPLDPSSIANVITIIVITIMSNIYFAPPPPSLSVVTSSNGRLGWVLRCCRCERTIDRLVPTASIDPLPLVPSRSTDIHDPSMCRDQRRHRFSYIEDGGKRQCVACQPPTCDACVSGLTDALVSSFLEVD